VIIGAEEEMKKEEGVNSKLRVREGRRGVGRRREESRAEARR
jgi:hypothetical protein